MKLIKSTLVFVAIVALTGCTHTLPTAVPIAAGQVHATADE